jgi:hypothetical protein
MTVSKAVKFRVEFTGVSKEVGEKSPGFVCQVVMVQEKGALSSFKAVQGMVKRDWELDVPVGGRGKGVSPGLGGGFVYV